MRVRTDKRSKNESEKMQVQTLATWLDTWLSLKTTGLAIQVNP